MLNVLLLSADIAYLWYAKLSCRQSVLIIIDKLGLALKVAVCCRIALQRYCLQCHAACQAWHFCTCPTMPKSEAHYCRLYGWCDGWRVFVSLPVY